MYCRFCGAELPDFSVFCGQCGKAQAETFPAQTEQPAAQQEASSVLPDTAGGAVGSDGPVVPFEENGKLTCPVCGEKGQPKNRLRCWNCGIPFAEGITVPKTEISTHAESKSPTMKIPMEYPTINAEDAAMQEAERQAKEQQRLQEMSSISNIKSLLIVGILCSAAASIAALFPVYHYWGKSATVFNLDPYTSVFVIACIILGPILLTIYSSANNARPWALPWCAMFANLGIAFSILGAMVIFEGDYGNSGETTTSAWISLFCSLTAGIIIAVAMYRIKDKVVFLHLHNLVSRTYHAQNAATQKTFTVRKDALEAVYEKYQKHKINQIVYIVACLMCINRLLWLTKQHSLDFWMWYSPGVIYFFVIGIVVFFGLFIWRAVQRCKYGRQLRNLSSSYLIVAEDHVEGISFSSLDDKAPIPFSVPIESITAAKETIGTLNLEIHTYSGTFRCLALDHAREAAYTINEQCKKKEG